VAAVATFALVEIRALMSIPPRDPIVRGEPAPSITGMTLDGEAFDLAALRGHPVLINFWGPNCVPCRDEFPLFKAKLGQHADTGLAIVGVLMGDPAAPARDFIAEYGATWPTVGDPDGVIRTTYRVAARPQTYFIDRDGILRSFQVGELTDAEFERQFALISGPGIGPTPSP